MVARCLPLKVGSNYIGQRDRGRQAQTSQAPGPKKSVLDRALLQPTRESIQGKSWLIPHTWDDCRR